MAHLLEWQIYVQADKARRGPPPEKIPTPWDPPSSTRSELTPTEMEQRLLAQRAKARQREAAAPH